MDGTAAAAAAVAVVFKEKSERSSRRSHEEVRGKRKELGSSLHYLSGLRYTDAPNAWT